MLLTPVFAKMLLPSTPRPAYMRMLRVDRAGGGCCYTLRDARERVPIQRSASQAIRVCRLMRQRYTGKMPARYAAARCATERAGCYGEEICRLRQRDVAMKQQQCLICRACDGAREYASGDARDAFIMPRDGAPCVTRRICGHARRHERHILRHITVADTLRYAVIDAAMSITLMLILPSFTFFAISPIFIFRPPLRRVAVTLLR